ncbi:MAG: hypothetical protein ABIA04_13995 [Pseudomonadota bacterium]
MIKSAQLGEELIIIVPNEIGVLSEISSYIAKKSVSILAISASTTSNMVVFKLLTDNNESAKEILKENGYNVGKREIVMVNLENKSGALEYVCSKLSENKIDFFYLYCSTCCGDCPAMLVFSSTNNENAVELLNK